MAHPIYNQNLGLIGILAQSGTPTDCIVFIGESSDFTLKATYKEWNGTVEYSTDRTTWTTWDGTAIPSNNKKLYLRGSGNTTFWTSNGARFVLSAKAGCSGNLNTLLEHSNPPKTLNADGCYRNMFRSCTNLTTAPELPATTLASNCYFGMFNGCTNLTTTPELPAITLASNCYRSMFNGCTKLTTAPELPATTLASSCYQNMFYECRAFKVSSSKTGTYQYEWRIPTSGTASTASNWSNFMLEATGGTFTSNPSINTTYYVENKPV